MRLRPNGTLDSTFGDSGLVLTPFTGTSAASSLLLRPNGGIVAVGSAGFPSTVALAGYQADGSLDPAFGTCGTTTTAVGANASATGAVFQKGPRILVAGAAFNQTGTAGSLPPRPLLRLPHRPSRLRIVKPDEPDLMWDALTR